MEITTMISDLIRYNTGYLAKHINNIEKSRLHFRPSQRFNPIIWILGHIVVSRASLLEMLGEETKLRNFHECFSSGTTPLSNPRGYPSIDEIMGELGKLGTSLVRHINNGGEKLLNTQAWGDYENIGKYLVNAYIHETYHVGQISYLLNMSSKLHSSKSKLSLGARQKDGTGKFLINSLKSVLTVR